MFSPPPADSVEFTGANGAHRRIAGKIDRRNRFDSFAVHSFLGSHRSHLTDGTVSMEIIIIRNQIPAINCYFTKCDSHNAWHDQLIAVHSIHSTVDTEILKLEKPAASTLIMSPDAQSIVENVLLFTVTCDN